MRVLQDCHISIYFNIFHEKMKRNWNSLKLSIPMTSTSDELQAMSNPTGHGDLSLNRPEIETIEEAFSCVVLAAKRHLKI